MGLFDIFKKKIIKKSNIPENTLNWWFDELVDQLSNGDLSSRFTSNVILKKGEKLIVDIPQVQYCEERNVKFKGKYSRNVSKVNERSIL